MPSSREMNRLVADDPVGAVLFFERVLIADDILEERLGSRRNTQEGYARLEARIAELEQTQGNDVGSQAGGSPNARNGRRDGE